MHPIRKAILKSLLFSTGKKFSELKPDNVEGSLLTFHLNELAKEGYLSKLPSGYSLTEDGKMLANKYDYDSKTPNMQAKLSVVVCPVRKNSTEILIYTRLKNPFYGCQGFMTGKVQYGENFVDTAKRELKEETNLEGEPKLIGIRHYRVADKKSGNLLEDKCMFVFKVIDPLGKLISNEEGKFSWIKIQDVQKFITNPLEEFEELLYLITNKEGSNLELREWTHVTSKF